MERLPQADTVLDEIKTAVSALLPLDNLGRPLSSNGITDELRVDLFKVLATLVPHLGTGVCPTLIRWRALAFIAGIDLTIAKWFESHLDAISILAEVGYTGNTDGLWAVWAAEGHPDPIRYHPDTVKDADALNTDTDKTGVINGYKTWCSGAHLVDHALMTCRDKDGQSQLLIVDMKQALKKQNHVKQNGMTPDAKQQHIDIDTSGWQAVGMQATDTATVGFNQVPATQAGHANEYLDRVGFWHGAAGVAACWYGATVAIAEYLLQSYQHKPNDYKAMYLGQISTLLAVTRQYFEHLAYLIDQHSDQKHERAIRQLRASVESLARQVVETVGLALGAAPFCTEAHFARLSTDLPVFIRQSHGAFDYRRIGEMMAKHKQSADPATTIATSMATPSVSVWQL